MFAELGTNAAKHPNGCLGPKRARACNPKSFPVLTTTQRQLSGAGRSKHRRRAKPSGFTKHAAQLPGPRTNCSHAGTPLFAFPAGPNAARKTQHDRSRPRMPRLGKRAGGRLSSLPRGRCRRGIKARTIRGARHREGVYILWWQRQPVPHLALLMGCELNGRNIEHLLDDGRKGEKWHPVERPEIRAVRLATISSIVRF